jgi:hypothetical protein
MVSTAQYMCRGTGYGFNSSKYFSGWELGVVLCCSFLRVGIRVSTFKEKLQVNIYKI